MIQTPGTSDKNTKHKAPIVIISGGLGSFEPRKPLISNLSKYEEKGVQYSINDPNLFINKKVFISGGGDSALDWAIYLAENSSQKIYLIHRSEVFRAHKDSVDKVIKLQKEGKIDFYTNAEIININGEINGYLPVNFEVRGFDLEHGRLFTEKENLGRKKVIVLGSKVPGELNTTARQILNKEIFVAGTAYKVVGILEEEGSTGWQNPDDDFYVPLLTASQRILGTERLGWINVGISNDTNVDYVMMTIEQILRQKHDIGPGGDNDFRINDWSQYSDLRRQATSIFTALIAGIAGISLIVGGIGVMNIMLVSVTERTREIGLRKALGATQNSIMMQFIIEAILLCILGGLIGVFIGVSLLFIFTLFNDWMFSIPFSAILGSIFFSALVGLFFGIWPAKRAARLDPAVSLRYE